MFRLRQCLDSELPPKALIGIDFALFSDSFESYIISNPVRLHQMMRNNRGRSANAGATVHQYACIGIAGKRRLNPSMRGHQMLEDVFRLVILNHNMEMSDTRRETAFESFGLSQTQYVSDLGLLHMRLARLLRAQVQSGLNRVHIQIERITLSFHCSPNTLLSRPG